jgi:hypothetical protein
MWLWLWLALRCLATVWRFFNKWETSTSLNALAPGSSIFVSGTSFIIVEETLFSHLLIKVWKRCDFIFSCIIFWDMTPCSLLSHIPEDDTLHNHCCENLKSYIIFACFFFNLFICDSQLNRIALNDETESMWKEAVLICHTICSQGEKIRNHHNTRSSVWKRC